MDAVVRHEAIEARAQAIGVFGLAEGADLQKPAVLWTLVCDLPVGLCRPVLPRDRIDRPDLDPAGAGLP
jgi:hypothetical protein